MKVLIVLICLPLFAGVAFSTDIPHGPVKDLCLLDNNNCVDHHYYNIVEKLARIRAALEVGTKLYSQQEIEHLTYMLDEALKTADLIDADPSQVPENKDR